MNARRVPESPQKRVLHDVLGLVPRPEATHEPEEFMAPRARVEG